MATVIFQPSNISPVVDGTILGQYVSDEELGFLALSPEDTYNDSLVLEQVGETVWNLRVVDREGLPDTFTLQPYGETLTLDQPFVPPVEFHFDEINTGFPTDIIVDFVVEDANQFGQVAENSQETTVVATLQGVDADLNETFTYAVTGGKDKDLFTVKDDKLVVKKGAVLDYESGNTKLAVEVTVTDSTNHSYTKNVYIDVANVNELTIANNDSAQTLEDTPLSNINVLANDTDEDGDSLSVVSATVDPAQGTVSVNADGTLNFVPAANFSGNATISYTITDGNPANTESKYTANLVVNVKSVNDAPVANSDVANTDEDTAVVINVLANDTDVDGDTLTVTGATVNPAQGTVTVNANGTLTFVPAANYNGPAVITYTVSDGNGGVATSTVEVDVAAVNDAPVAVVDTASTNEDTAVSINVLANDTDVDGDTLTVTGATVNPAQGTVTVNANGTLTFVPAANYNGPAVITYTVSDGNGGVATSTVAVDVAAVNDAPVAVVDTASTNEDTAVSINVLANDTDVDGDTLTVTGATVNPAQGTVTVNANGTLTFVPAANYNGPAVITYSVSDGQGGVSTSTVNVTVVPVNDAPTDIIPTVKPVSEHAAAGTVVATLVVVDPDVNDTHTFALSGANADKFTVNPTTGVITVKSDDALYLGCAAGGKDGSYVVDVTVTDAAGASYTEAVTINVTNILEAPVIFCQPCSCHDLVVKGYDNNDYIQTGSGDDTVYACNGNDTVITNCGDDVVYAGGGNDTVCLGSGNDTVFTGTGADTVDGSCGTDTVNYVYSQAAVTVSLDSCSVGKGGDAEGDRLYSIENLIGSNFDDKLSGSCGANMIDGGAGNDTISGSSCDTIIGGLGNDLLLVGSACIDAVKGGEGVDTLKYNGITGLDMDSCGAPIVTGIEFVDMTGGSSGGCYGSYGNWLELDSNSLDKMIDTNVLYVKGDYNDRVYLDSNGYCWEPKDWSKAGSSVVDGVLYNGYMSDHNQLVMVQSGVGVCY